VDNTKSPLAVLRGHKGQVYAASFSADGKFLATGGRDGTARLWRVAQPTAIAEPDRSLENWTKRLDELVSLAGGTAGRDLTKEEWEKFFPDEQWRPTVPRS
jgi:WD40 repeat protein